MSKKAKYTTKQQNALLGNHIWLFGGESKQQKNKLVAEK